MRRLNLFLFALLWWAALPASAQQVLPQSFGGWSAAAPGAATSSATSTVVSPNILAEYGWLGTESQQYAAISVSRSGALGITLFRMKDPTGGYGLYSYLHAPGMAHVDLTDHASISRDRALILLGNLVLDVRGDVTTALPDMKALIGMVKPHAQVGPLPMLWQLLPTKTLVEGTDHYVLGAQTLNEFFPVALGESLGLNAGTEAEVARYRSGGHESVLLIADFPTPQLALQSLAELRKKYNLNGSVTGASAPPLYAKRALTLLAIVSGPSSKTEAAALLDQVRSGDQLTWDEPTFRFKEPGIEVMVLGAILGTGVILGFALIASLAFGGFRILVKRTFPNKVFDRSEQLQVLQLGLSSKPINAEDFYGPSEEPAPAGQVDPNLPDRIALRIFR